jgi:hypothetical protein
MIKTAFVSPLLAAAPASIVAGRASYSVIFGGKTVGRLTADTLGAKTSAKYTFKIRHLPVRRRA